MSKKGDKVRTIVFCNKSKFYKLNVLEHNSLKEKLNSINASQTSFPRTSHLLQVEDNDVKTHGNHDISSQIFFHL